MSAESPVDQARLLAGRFIVLDGPDGCGKTTQARLLAERLRAAGVGVEHVRDPGTTTIGERIRAILLDAAHTDMAMRCEMLLYMAARAQMMAQVIAPALASGQAVVCERFVSATLAYQLGGDGLTAEEIRTVASVALTDRWPDVTLILDLPEDVGLARARGRAGPAGADRIELRDAAYHQRVRANFLSQASADPARCRFVSAHGTPAEVHAAIWSQLQQALQAWRPGRNNQEPDRV